MTKTKYLFCTKMRMFLSEIPLAVLLAFAIRYNGSNEGPFKLWPLIIAVSGFMIFIAVYFFRAISISEEEIRAIGRFSSRYCCTINKGKTLIFTLRKKRKLRVELFGIDERPAFDWVKEDEEPVEINLFSERAIGSRRSVEKMLAFFGVDRDDFEAIFLNESFEKDYDLVKVTTEIVNEEKKVKLKFLKTV